MDLGLYIAASGMIAEQQRQDQLSNDLANASTPGYKPDTEAQSDFNSVLIANQGGQVLGSLPATVGLDRTVSDLTPAPLTQTGNPLDFGINGSGFFAVSTAQGVRYTRNGQFTGDSQGRLVDQLGNPVLSQTGSPVRVGADGKVAASALGIFNVPTATKQGDNLFTGAAAGRGTGTIQQGSLETSGVNPTTVIVEMTASLRAFQSGQQVIQAIDETMQRGASQVGTVNGG